MVNSSPGPKTYSLGAAMMPLESNEVSISKRSYPKKEGIRYQIHHTQQVFFHFKEFSSLLI